MRAAPIARMICPVAPSGSPVLERVLVAIRSARPSMRLRARAVIEAVLLSKGPIGSAQAVARALGLSNRFQLARLLESEGLPPLHRMTEWVTVLNWIESAEREHVSLCWMAFRSRRHPSSCYRLVKKVTGRGWEVVLGKGSAWTLRQFLVELRAWGRQGPPPSHRLPPVASRGRAGRYPHAPLKMS